jgi:hypothetical protein
MSRASIFSFSHRFFASLAAEAVIKSDLFLSDTASISSLPLRKGRAANIVSLDDPFA